MRSGPGTTGHRRCAFGALVMSWSWSRGTDHAWTSVLMLAAVAGDPRAMAWATVNRLTIACSRRRYAPPLMSGVRPTARIL
jgi:hypothetical protein